MVAVEQDVLVIDLDFAHTLSQHNHGALLNGSQHTYARENEENKAVFVS